MFIHAALITNMSNTAATQVDPKGGTVVVGFADGVVRVLSVSKLLDDASRKKKHHECSLLLLQATKPHSHPVTSLAIDNKGEVLASGVRT